MQNMPRTYDAEVLAFRAPSDATKAAVAGIATYLTFSPFVGIVAGFPALVAWAIVSSYLKWQARRPTPPPFAQR